MRPIESSIEGRSASVQDNEAPDAGTVLRVVSYFTVTPTTEAHFLVMVSFDAACCARVGNNSLS